MGRSEDIFQTIKREGIAAIDSFILQRTAEELFLDFKRSADNGARDKLDSDDRKNLGRMISAFGNSSGGVIVWGIDCSYDPTTQSDLPRAKVPIADVVRFISRLEGAVSGCTLPAHPGVSHFAIPVPGTTDGFVVTHIPESPLAPLQTINDKRYLIRAGSNCEQAPHGVLAGMFGRKPTPAIFTMFTEGQPILHGDTVKFQLGFVLAHKTPVIARDLYFTIFLKSAPGANCKLEFRPDLSGFWTWNSAFGVRFSGFTNDQFKLAPEMLLQAGAITVYLKEPFTENFALEYFYGCSGSPIGSESVVVTPGNVASAWQTHVTPKIVSGATLPDIDRAFVGKVLPLNYGQRGCA